ncbi:MAG TPA: hypothetical protein VGP72_10340 [Planctomycetota bacterium]|jgi:integrase
MPKLSRHPGVSLVQPAIGAPIQISFKHPLRERKQVKQSLRTTDAATAEKMAIQLSGILADPAAWSQLPGDTAPILKAIWEGDAVDQILQETAAAAKQGAFAGRLQVNGETVVAVPVQAAADQGDEVRRLREALAAAEAKVCNLTGLLKKLGWSSSHDYSPKLLSVAIEDWLGEDKRKNGTHASDRKKLTYKSWLKKLAATLPESAIVHEITPDVVINCLADMLAKGLQRETVLKAGRTMESFLTHQTNGIFSKDRVEYWIKKNCNGRTDEEPENPQWLDARQVELMLAEMPTFWRRAAMVQWAGGFRAEELANLQREKAYVNGDIRLEVAAIRDEDGGLVWRPKTDGGYGKVHLPEFARETMREILAENKDEFLLFANDPAQHGGKSPRNQTSRKLWGGDSWCEQYLAQITAAAKKANEKGAKIDLGSDASGHPRLDSRTLRRSAGKRILLDSGYDLKLTAAVLRDAPETVRKHYARILPDDVTQPDAKK